VDSTYKWLFEFKEYIGSAIVPTVYYDLDSNHICRGGTFSKANIKSIRKATPEERALLYPDTTVADKSVKLSDVDQWIEDNRSKMEGMTDGELKSFICGSNCPIEIWSDLKGFASVGKAQYLIDNVLRKKSQFNISALGARMDEVGQMPTWGIYGNPPLYKVEKPVTPKDALGSTERHQQPVLITTKKKNKFKLI